MDIVAIKKELLKHNSIHHDKRPDKYFILNCRFGYLEKVKFLVNHNRNYLNNVFGLRLAARHGKLEIVNFLISNGTNLHANQDYPLQLASQKGHLKIIRFLVANGSDIQADDNYAIQLATINDNLETIKFLIFNDASVRPGDNYALRVASESGYLTIVQFLLANDIYNDINIQASHNYAIRWASAKGHLEMVKYLITHGADIHSCNNYPIRFASQNGHFEIVRYLVANGTDIQAGNNEILKWAIHSGNLDLIKFLVAHSADIKVITSEMLVTIKNRGNIRVYNYFKKKLKIRYIWRKLAKSIFVKGLSIPKAKWQRKYLELNKLQKIIKDAGLFICRSNKTLYSIYLLKFQLAIQMTLLKNIPTIKYEHVDCNNLSGPICHDLTTSPEHELIKDKNNNWYHITDLIDRNGKWKMIRNPYTKDSWKDSLLVNLTELQIIWKNYKPNKLQDIHELKVSVNIYINMVRTIMIELDRSTNSDHLTLIDKIHPTKLVKFFREQVVCLQYFRNYTTKELSVMNVLSGYKLLYKFLIITRTIMTDVNLSSYIGQFISISLGIVE